jgi:hypothetical protein
MPLRRQEDTARLSLARVHQPVHTLKDSTLIQRVKPGVCVELTSTPGASPLESNNPTDTTTLGAFSKLNKQEQHVLAARHQVRLTQDGAPSSM